MAALPKVCTLLAAVFLLCIEVGAFNCPINCKCNNGTKSVRCINRKLKKLPLDLPLDVKQLILRGNRIHDFTGITNLTSLSILDLSDNKITDIAGLANLRSLTILDLSRNSLAEWRAKWLEGLTLLHQLKLTQNNLEEPPAPLCSLLPALKALFLDNNKMSGTFPADYSNCLQLTRLTLSNNAFDAIDNKTLCSLRGATSAHPAQFSLKLNRQKLNNHSHIQSGALSCLADRLVSLDLSQNSLPQEKLEALIGGSGLSKMRSLSLKMSDLLRSVSPQLLAGVVGLNALMLDGSGSLMELSPDAFTQTPLLSHLSLSRTGVAGWKGVCLDQLSKLRQLDLRNTSVTTIGGLNGSDVNSLHQLTASSSFANLSLLGAPLACDCSANWLAQKLALPSVRARLVDAGRLTCAQPAEMRGRRLLEFTPANCDNQPSPAGFFTHRMIVILAASGGAFLLLVFIAIPAAVVVCRRRRRGDGEAPRLVFNGVDDLRDPLVAPEDGRWRGDSVWIRLRRFLRQRRERSAASAGQPGRPPIFDPSRQPEDYLAADHVT